jgi:hypothetical protein
MFKIRAVHKEKLEELNKSSNTSGENRDVDNSENKDNEESTYEESSKDKSNLSLSSTSSLSTSKNIVINSKSIPANTVRGTSSSNMMRPSNYEGGYETDLY